MTKLIKIFVLSLAALQFIAASAQPRGYSISPVNAESVVSEAYVRSCVETLCDDTMEGRATGTAGSQKAARYLDAEFRSIGLEPISGAYMHGFGDVFRPGRNVMGYLPGSGQGFVIVMAHYDGLGVVGGRIYPGADSNASGVAALLQLAKMAVRMNQVGYNFGKGILFVAVDAKEKNLAGSAELWSRLALGRLGLRTSDLSMVINIDQLGSTQAPLTKGNPDYLIMLTEGGRHMGTLESASKVRNIRMELAGDYYGSRDFTTLFYRKISDQKVFLENGVDCVMFTSGITMLNNKPGDNPDSLDYPVLMKRIRLIFYFLFKIL